MAYLFLLVFLCSPIALIVFLVKPSWLHKIISRVISRKQILALFTSTFVSSFFLFGATAPPSTKTPSDEVKAVVSQSPELTNPPEILVTATPLASITLTPTLVPSKTPVQTPTRIPKPTVAQSTTKPSELILPLKEIEHQESSSSQCSCSKTCSAMSSCDEAYFQLNECGCSARDGDDDGVPCEDICPGG